MTQWSILVPIITAALGATLTFLFANRAQRDRSILRFKERHYASLLVKMQGFVGKTAGPHLKREFFEEQYRSWLYASDDVIRAINTMVEFVKCASTPEIEADPIIGFRLVGNIVLSMRRDLLGKTTLESDDFKYTDVGDPSNN